MNSDKTGFLVPGNFQQGLKDKYVVDAQITTLGRHPSNKICIPLDSVSRFHAKIEIRDDDFVIIDLQSSNGTFVNGKKIQSAFIKNSDIILIGEIEFKFFTGSEENIKDSPATDSTVDIITTDSEMPSRILAAKPGSDVEKLSTDIEELQKSDKNLILTVHRRLATLYKLNELLHSATDEKNMLSRVTDLIFEILPADRTIILTKPHPTSKDFEPVIVRQKRSLDKNAKISISKTMIQKVATEQLAILSLDAQTDNRFSSSESIIAHDIRSTMCVPIITKNVVVGVIHVDTKESVHAFNDEDLTFLTSIANELSVALENLKMRDEMIKTERMAAVGMTVTNIAHNIKNILLLSKGGTQLVSTGLANKNFELVNESWEIVKRGMDKISKLVQDMLSYSRVRKIIKSKINVNDLVREVVESISTGRGKKNVNYQMNLDDKVPVRPIDEEGLTHALENLIVNASEAIIHDHGLITIYTKFDEEQNIIIRVEDNGSGISKQNLERLFFPFFTTKGSAGTGLGLPMTKKEIEEMKGKISCESEEGVGTAFIIALPYLPEDEELDTVTRTEDELPEQDND